MRKFTLLLITLALCTFVYGQMNAPMISVREKVNSADKPTAHPKQAKAPGDVIWSNNFSVPADWTMGHEATTTENWIIANSAPARMVQYMGGAPTYFPTYSNGFAYIDGITHLVDEGTAPIHHAWLTSPTIDLTSYAGVTIKWWQNYKAFNSDTCYLDLSIDGGTTWSTVIPMFNELAANAYAIDTPSFNISTYVGGQANVKFRFRWVTSDTNTSYGCGYGWEIDDVSLVECYANELLIENPTPLFGTGFYHQMPMNQRVPITDFIGPIFNDGSSAQTNVTMNVKIYMDDGTTPVFDNFSNSPVNIPSIPRDTRDTLRITGDAALYFYADTLAYHYYDVDFNVSQTEIDQNPNNNTSSRRFFITDSVLNRATTVSTYFGVNNFTGGTSGDILGQMMYISNPDSVSSITVKFHSALTANGINAVRPQLYYWNTTTSAWALQIEGNDIILETAMQGTEVTLPFLRDMTSEYVAGGDYYIAGIRCILNDDSLDNIAFGADNIYPHDFQYSSRGCFGGTWYYLSSGVPMVKLNFIRNTPVPNNVNSTEIGLVNVYPNPTNGMLNIENAPNSNITVFNMLGEAVASLNNSGTYSRIDLSGLAEGTYIVKILNSNSIITKKINLVK